MESNFILVLGAGGNLGGKVAEELLERGEQVGVVGRNHSRMSQFEGRAELFIGDFNDDAFLQQAFGRATSLFLTVPDDAFTDVRATAERLERLLHGSPVSHIVNISNSIIRKSGAPTRLLALEEELNQRLPQHLLHLRSGNFFENLNWGLHTPYAPDLKLPYISSYEVAHIAANHLQRLDFTGKQAKGLLGARDYSMSELAEAAGVVYRQLPYSSENINFYQPFNEGDFEVEPRRDTSEQYQDERFTLKYFLANELKAVQ